MSVGENRMNRIKILHIVGVDKENYYLNNLVSHSSRDNVQFSFATLAGDCEFGKSLMELGHTVHYLDSPKRKEFAQALRKLSAIVRIENPDIIHTHLFEPSLIGLTVAKCYRRKTVLTRNHSDAVHLIASPLKRRFYLTLENYINRNSDHIIAPSRAVFECLVKFEGVSDRKVTIIPYGQTTARFDAITDDLVAEVRNELEMEDGIALVCVSRLFNRKGHSYLFDAFRRLLADGLDVKLYLVGTGDHREALQQQAFDLGIGDKIRFLGWRNDALVVMKAADVIVHPSLEDALSSAVIESVMLEKPIVATDISGVRDTLSGGKYGTVVPPADAACLYRAVKDVIENIEVAKERAVRGRQYLLDYMDATRVADLHTRIYRDLASEG